MEGQGKGKGKSGGVRIIYYLELAEFRFLMLTLYAKYELENLTLLMSCMNLTDWISSLHFTISSNFTSAFVDIR